MSEDEEKVKLRRLEPAIQKFTKIVIPTDLERLRKHQINIEKYQRCRIWDKLHEEHINAGRTVQQLRSNIREMEKLCLKVQKDDLGLLKRMIDPVKEEASAATAEFLQLHLESVEELKKQFNDEETLLQPSLTRSMTVGGTFHTTEDEADPQSMTQIYVLPEIPRDQNAAESWETLEADLIELSHLVTDFSLLVNSQQEKIDSVEDHVSSAAVNVEEGTKNLGKAAKYKLAALPVAGMNEAKEEIWITSLRLGSHELKISEFGAKEPEAWSRLDKIRRLPPVIFSDSCMVQRGRSLNCRNNFKPSPHNMQQLQHPRKEIQWCKKMP
ncbi:syntaxin-17 isoform X2 [Physeter macrocephalus]|uniref:Syntaxin-17 n=1 Tax=Physeter macrocephalus TaxID=9755 RepID=A0A455BL09_PHYMC|nr:syntaxin-17 isoform X2 [Physeter catodon]|eukprot:XP_028349564.1 syntaxin-17 isoform X2 [Physeter catodon]